jgi:hypothetical protein
LSTSAREERTVITPIARFDALVGSEREIWVGDDGSGMIRSTSGPATFFTDEGRSAWEAAGSPQLEGGPSIDLFAPDCLGGSQARRSGLTRDPDGPDAALTRYVKRLHDAQELLGEGVVSEDLCAAAYRVASQLPGVAAIDQLNDELGRAGRGLVETDRGDRVELVFASDLTELLGYRHLLAESRDYAPAGTLHSWASFLQREIVTELPPFHVTTGYVTDAVAQPAAMRDQGVITDAEYDSALAYQHPH